MPGPHLIAQATSGRRALSHIQVTLLPMAELRRAIKNYEIIKAAGFFGRLDAQRGTPEDLFMSEAVPDLDLTDFAEGSGNVLADRRFTYGRACAAEGDYAAAADLFAQTTELVPQWAPVWLALGEAHLVIGDRAEAIAALQQGAGCAGAERLGIALVLAHLDAGPLPSTAPADYVAGLFDDYAHRFDAHLVGSLGYNGPAVLLAALDAVAGAGTHFGTVIDLGCGTGLMGVAIRDRSGQLHGVDLSAKMLAKARERAVYDELTQGDVTAALQAVPSASLDLVLAADVLVYIGDLSPLLSAARGALVSGGLCAFTLQAASAGDYEIGADRRYAHSVGYVERIALQNGFAVAHLAEVSTRRDGGRDIAGLVFVLVAR